MNKAGRLAIALFGLLFLGGAMVQYNDPDPLRWMAIYLAGSAACFLAAMGRLHWAFAAVTAAGAFIWAVTLAPRVFPKVRVPELFQGWEMANTRIEEGREMYGLLLIFIVMTFLAIAVWMGFLCRDGR